jgi:hypothetical protein
VNVTQVAALGNCDFSTEVSLPTCLVERVAKLAAPAATASQGPDAGKNVG